MGPTISTSLTGFITVNAAGAMTYRDLIRILGFYNFRINSIYLFCTDVSQLVQPLAILKKNEWREIRQDVVYPWIDPYQMEPALYVSTRQEEFILDGFSTLNFLFNTGDRLIMVLDAEEQANSDVLDALHFGGNVQMIDE